MAENITKKNLAQTLFSGYGRPITNLVSKGSVSLYDTYLYIKTDKEAWQKTQELRKITDAKERRQFKARNFDYVLFSGIFTSRNDAGLQTHSGLICIDFDHLGYRLTCVREQLLQDPYFKTWLLFRSPTGDGLKWTIGIDLSKGSHEQWFKAIQQYIRQSYNVEIDSQCKNVSRACFLPGDPNVFVAPEVLNPDACIEEMSRKEFILDAWQEPDAMPFATADDEAEIRLCADAIIGMGKDITASYVEFRNLGFALSDGIGEAGRQIYHDLCKMYPGYDFSECDHQYDECLKGRKTGITINTFWMMARNAGVDISEIARNARRESLKPISITDAQSLIMSSSGEVCASCANVPSGITEQNAYINNVHEEIDEFVPRGTMAQVAQPTGKTFSDKIKREDLPSWLWPVIDSHKDDVDRDKMLLGSINLVSGILPRSYYSIYDGRRVYAALYNIIFGGFATSKGDLECCRQLVMPIKQEMRQQYAEEKAAYETDKALWDSKSSPKERGNRGPAPQEPVYRSPLITANSSASALLRALDANDGWGMLFETEADTLSNMLSRSEYGDYTDVLRKAHQHEECSMIRVSEKVNIEIPDPKLSMLLTCTPSQLPLLLPPNNVANGLASRMLFYALPDSKIEFRDVFARQDAPIEETYKLMGLDLLRLYHALNDRMEKPLQFVMSKQNQQAFVERYNGMLHEQFAMLGDGIQGFIFRLALECYRYAMILTALRRLSERGESDRLFDDDEQALLCDDRDFNTAMVIVDCLVNHTARVFSALGSTDNDPFKNSTEKPSEDLKMLYKALPDGKTFKTSEVIAAAQTINMSERTAKRRLGEMVSKFDVLERIGQGCYIKKTQTSANGSKL